MKTSIRSVLLSLLVLSALPVGAQERRFAVIDYMNIPEGRSEEDYIATEKLWQRLHQKAVDAGLCKAWFLEKVENGGRAQYVTIRIYDSLERIANPWPESLVKDLYNADEMKTMNKTGAARDLIRSELWEIEASLRPDSGGDPATYVYVDFMKPKPGKGDEYYKMEKNTWKKIHEARQKAGEMKNWHFMSRMFPSGTDQDYEFVTVNVYASKEQNFNIKTAEEALGKEEVAKLADPTTVRTIVREEVWRPVLATTAKK